MRKRILILTILAALAAPIWVGAQRTRDIPEVAPIVAARCTVMIAGELYPEEMQFSDDNGKTWHSERPTSENHLTRAVAGGVELWRAGAGAQR